MNRFLRLALPAVLAFAGGWVALAYVLRFGVATTFVGAIAVGLICGGMASK